MDVSVLALTGTCHCENSLVRFVALAKCEQRQSELTYSR